MYARGERARVCVFAEGLDAENCLPLKTVGMVLFLSPLLLLLLVYNKTTTTTKLLHKTIVFKFTQKRAQYQLSDTHSTKCLNII